MKKLILCMQSELYAKALKRIFVQDMDEYSVEVSSSPGDLTAKAKLLSPDIVIAEVNDYSPWRAAEMTGVVERIRESLPCCRFVFIFDETNTTLLDSVKKLKQRNEIDAFLFTSVTEKYMLAVIDSL